MGLFKSIKKAFKKVVKGVKKVVKKVVKGVKKVAKKIGSSKILKALAIAAAVVVTGGAALTAFGGTGAVASSTFGQWMMGVSQNVLGGTAFGTAAGKKGVAKFLTQAGNFAAKTAGKPFGAVGGALGSTARVGANILTGAEGGAFSSGSAIGAPTPFSKAALTGQMNTSNIYYDETANMYFDNSTGTPVPLNRDEVARLPNSFTEQDAFGIPKGANVLNEAGEVVQPTVTEPTRFRDTGVGNFVSDVGSRVVTNVVTGAAMQSIQGDPDATGAIGGSGRQEGSSNFDPLRIYAAANNMDIASIYNQPMYGNVDPSSMYGSELYNQQTVGVA